MNIKNLYYTIPEFVMTIVSVIMIEICMLTVEIFFGWIDAYECVRAFRMKKPGLNPVESLKHFWQQDK
jgi:hypothetical protein